MLGISLSEWNSLIFPLINLDELIYLKRTCKRFYNCNLLKQQINKQIKQIFVGSDRKFWNKLCHLKPKSDSFAVISKYINKYPYGCLISNVGHWLSEADIKAALFSVKDRLNKCFLRCLGKHTKKVYIRYMDNGLYVSDKDVTLCPRQTFWKGIEKKDIGNYFTININNSNKFVNVGVGTLATNKYHNIIFD